MKLDNIFMIRHGIFLSVQYAFLPTLKAVTQAPGLLWPTRWNKLSAVFMANVWLPFGAEVDGNAKEAKERLLAPPNEEERPKGVVLDLGAGM